MVRRQHAAFPFRVPVQDRQTESLALQQLPVAHDIHHLGGGNRRNPEAAVVVGQGEALRRQPDQRLPHRGHAGAAERLEIGEAQPLPRWQRSAADRVQDGGIGIARERTRLRPFLYLLHPDGTPLFSKIMVISNHIDISQDRREACTKIPDS